MDCETFDLHLMDALYDELDSMTRAAMAQHSETCTRCAAVAASLRATVEAARLPVEEPSEDLEERILSAARTTQRQAPFYRRMVQMVAWAGSHAMRPQLAMAALLVLVLGSSILLLRARPGAVGISPVRVTEQGAPASEGQPESAQARRVAGEEAERAAPGDGPRVAGLDEGLAGDARSRGAAGDGSGLDDKGGSAARSDEGAEGSDEAERFDRGLSNYRAGRMDEARTDFAAVAGMGGTRAAAAALYEARAVRSLQGCAAAVPLYEHVRSRHAQDPAAADAAWEQADCLRILGQLAAAERIWRALESDPTYGRRATNELADRGQVATASRQGSSSAAAAPPAATAAAPEPAGPRASATASPRPPTSGATDAK